MAIRPFLLVQGSRARFFSGFSAGDSRPLAWAARNGGQACPLRIPLDKPFDFTPRWCSGPEPVERLRAMNNVEWLRAAVSPISKPRKNKALRLGRLRQAQAPS